MTRRLRGPAATVAAVLATTVLRADVYYLVDGDRVTGRTLSSTSTAFRIQTAYGRLVIPQSQVERFVREDGTEVLVNPRAMPEIAAPAPQPKQPFRLTLVVTGHAFWYAWDPPRGVVIDPTLRLEVSLDEAPAAEYLDRKPDPEDIPHAGLVNTFAFGAEEVSMSALAPVKALPPESRPGRTVLRLELPDEGEAERRLRVTYQINTGAESGPAWRDMASASVDVLLRRDGPTVVQLHQDRGRMEYSGLLKRRMKNTETFRIELRRDSTAADPHPAP